MAGAGMDGPKLSNPLGFMQRLSASVMYYEPTTSSIAHGSSNAKADPELILLSTWMGARENHIAKYVQEYRVLFPTSRILVAQCPFTHVVMPFLAWTQIRPAVPILKEVVESESRHRIKDDSSSVLTGQSTTPRVLIHAFSNGGISTTLFLYNALKRSLGGTLTLPQHVFIFDSCPGTFRWRNTARAIMQVLPRWYSPAVHAVLFSVWLFYRVVPLLQPRQNVNSRTIRNPRFQEFEARRTYLYGTEDHMIPPSDVEHEAGLAAEAGFSVRLERFEDATHVAIPMFHPERYWRVVKETWYGEDPVTLTSIAVEGHEGKRGSLEPGIGSETVTREIKIVDNEKSISEETGILADDLKRDGKDALNTVEKTAQDASQSVQSAVRAAATSTEEAKKQSQVVAEKAQSKVEDLKTDAFTAIEQGQAKVKQLRANAVGAAKEVDVTANRKSLSKETNTIVEGFKEDAANTHKDAEQTAKEAEENLGSSTQGVEKKLKDAPSTKSKYAERPRTPDTTTALQAALAAASSSSPDVSKDGSSPQSSSLGRSNSNSSNKALDRSSSTRSNSGSGVQELAAKFGGKVDRGGMIKTPKAKTSQAELSKVGESLAPAAEEEEPVEQKAKVGPAKMEQTKPAVGGNSSSGKSKKSKKNSKK